jgi:hypothetical protein
MTLFRDLDRYWFGWQSPTALGVYRILFGLLSTANFLLMSAQWQDWFGERGFHPSWLSEIYLGKLPPLFGVQLSRINLFSIWPTDAWSAILFFSGLVLSVLLTLGKWTKPVSIALALVIISMHHRSPMILHGGDTVVRLMAIYLAISPCGQACSLDRLHQLRSGSVLPGAVKAPIWSQRMISFNISLIYFTTVWLKFGGNLWRDGLATYYPNRLQEFERFPVPEFVKDVPFVKLTTYGTLLVEFAFVSLVYYKPYRKYVLGAAMLMHLFIEYSMNIPLFAFLMITSYITFYDGEEVSAWTERLGKKVAHARVPLPVPSTGPCEAAHVISASDIFNLVEVVPGETEPTDAEIRRAALRCPGAWMVLLIPGLWRRLWQAGGRHA